MKVKLKAQKQKQTRMLFSYKDIEGQPEKEEMNEPAKSPIHTLAPTNQRKSRSATTNQNTSNKTRKHKLRKPSSAA